MFERPRGDRDSFYSIQENGQKLYDRFNEERLLLERFQVITQSHVHEFDEPHRDGGASEADNFQKEFVLITGRSGTGKTALASTVRAQLERLGGFFLRGKFDQLRQNTAYAAFVHAFTDWTHQVMSRAQKQVAAFPFATENIVLEIDDPSGELSGALSSTASIGSTSSILVDLEQLRSDINKATGGEAKILTQMIPALSEILDDQPDETPLSGVEAQQRFFRVFRSFVFSICHSLQAPLVLFLDDLQWADKESLDLVVALLADDLLSSSRPVDIANRNKSSRNMMILGACRENEVTVQHYLSCTLRSMEDDHGIKVTEIHLNNLGKEAVGLLVSDTLELPVDRVSLLAEQIYEITRGNVYSTISFLRSVLESTALKKTSEEGKSGESDELRGSEDPNNVYPLDVVEVRDLVAKHLPSKMVRNQEDTTYKCQEIDPVDVLRERITRFPHAVQETLKTMACLGAELEEEILLVALDDREKGERSIREAKCAGLIDEVSTGLYGRSSMPQVCFSHDKVQEAAYELIPEELRPSYHVRIGRRLREVILDSYHGASEIGRRLLGRFRGKVRLFVVNQFLLGMRLIDSEEERIAVARLCLRVGGQSARASSFRVAASYLEHAITLLPENSWSGEADCYELTLKIFTMAAEVEYSVGNYSRSDALVMEILKQARSLEDKLPAYTTRMYSLGSRHHLLEAIDTGLFVLEELGEPIPRHIRPIHLLVSLMKTKRMLRRARWDRIPYLPLMKDAKKLAVMRVLNLMFTYTFSARPEMAVLSTNLSVQLTVKHGLSAMSAPGFGFNAMILRLFRNEKDDARRCGELATQLVQRFRTNEWVPRVYAAVYGMANSNNLPFRECIDRTMEAYRIGMMSGDTEFSMMSLCLAGFMRFCVCLEPFDAMYKDFVDHWKMMVSLHQDNVATYHACTLQAVSNIIGEENDTLSLTGKYLNEAEALAHARAQHNESLLVNIFVFKAFLAYLCAKYSEADELIKSARCLRIGTTSIVLFNQLTFIECLTALALARASHRAKWKQIQRARWCLKALKQKAVDMPTDLNHRIYFIEAELAALQGTLVLALDTYDKAGTVAQAEGRMTDFAMILERKAFVLQENGKGGEGLQAMQQAASLFASSGAKIKAQQIFSIVNKSGL